MNKAAVIGNPIDHSWSPAIHEFWFNEKKIEGSYEKIKVEKENLKDFISEARERGYSGLNVTVPYKEEVYQYCDVLSVSAQKLKAVNLMEFKNNLVYGHNTDGDGFVDSILDVLPNISFKKNTFAVLGAGGAAKSIILSLIKNKAQKIIIINRDIKRAENIAEKSGKVVAVCPNEKITEGLREASFVINATSMGMKGGPPSKEIKFSSFPNIQCFADIVYNPGVTQLMEEAAAADIKVIGGLGMLINQAIPAFESFFSERPKNTKALVAFLENKIQEDKND